MIPLNILPAVFGGGGGPIPLSKIFENRGLNTHLQLCLDAGDSSSYPGTGQTWFDTSGNGDNFVGTYIHLDRIEHLDDRPEFNGTAGNLSENEYFSFGGNDEFAYDNTSLLVPTWYRDLRDDSAQFSIGALIYGTFDPHTGSIFDSESLKFVVRISPTQGEIILYIDSRSVSVETDNDNIAINTWHFVGVSVNESSTTGGFIYRDGNYQQVDSSNTFDPTYTITGADRETRLKIGSGIVGDFHSDSRIAMVFAVQGSFLTKADFDNIYNDIKSTRPGFNLP